MRVVLIIVLTRHWLIYQVDFNNASLNKDFEKSVFMSQHERFTVGGNHLVFKLNKALHGLKQASKAQFSKLHHVVTTFGFVLAKCNSSLFIRAMPHCILYVLVHVDDDIIIESSKQAISDLIATLNYTFSLKDLGQLHYFFEN